MRAKAAKHERTSSQSMICILCIVGLLLILMSLGSVRLYGLYLEHRLALVTSEIEQIAKKNTVLEERCSALLSPSRIYNYAKSELKMITASEIKTIRLKSSSDGGMTVASVLTGSGNGSPRFRVFSLSFVGEAHAEDQE